MEVYINKPFLKWVGGKTQIINHIIKKFPKHMNNYYEPFLGGGSVLLALLSYKKAGHIEINGKVFVNDINENLIALYRNIQKEPQAVIKEVNKIYLEFEASSGTHINRNPQSIDEAKTSREAYYYWIRKQFNILTKEERIKPIGSAMMLFLNKTCFRGLYREGPNGFNVPYGNYKKPTILEVGDIMRISELIQEVEFICDSYKTFLSNVATEDFVYLDPPYAPESSTSFVNYTASGFTMEDHTSVLNLCKDIVNKNAKMLLSNADVSFVKEAFDDKYNIDIISCRRAIHSKEPASRTNEVLIYNH